MSDYSIVKTQMGETVITMPVEEFVGFAVHEKGRTVEITLKTLAYERLKKEEIN